MNGSANCLLSIKILEDERVIAGFAWYNWHPEEATDVTGLLTLLFRLYKLVEGF
jgi:hypothetical protein